MTGTFYPTNPSDEVLTALATFGRANQAMLGTLLDRQVGPDEVRYLQEAPAVSEIDGHFSLTPDRASELLTTLERDDLSRYRHLHERAIALLANRLQIDDEEGEPGLMAAFDRLANRLITDDPQRLLTLAEEAQRWPIGQAANRQRCAYYQGVGLFEAERYNEALVVFNTLLSDPDLDINIRGRALNSRARCYQINGRLGEAMTGFHTSLEHWRQLGNQRYEGIVLLNMGIVAYDLQNYDEAELYLRQAETIFEAIGSKQWLGDVYNELGLIYRDRGQWSEALAHFEKYIAQRQAEGAEDRVGRGLNNIGEVLLFQGRFEEALTAFRDALDTMTTRVFRIDTHLFMGLTYQAQSNLDQAEQSFREALTVALDIGRRDILAEIHYRLGECLSQSGDPEAALAEFEAGAAIIETTREPLRDEGLKISLLGRWQQIYETLILHCLALNRPADAFAWAERARARAFTDVLLADRVEPDQAASPSASPVTVSDIQAVLPANSALLCYFTTGVLERDIPLLKAISDDNPLRSHLLTPPHTLLFVWTPDDLTVHACPVNPNAFSSTSRRRDDRERFWAPAVLRRLYGMLLEPAGEALHAERLYIVPHGPLHHVPFGALIDASHQALVRQAGPRLAYAPSATALAGHHLWPQQPKTGLRSCLAIGYEGPQERGLRHTEAEAAFVAELTGGAGWIGAQPKKARLRTLALEYAWLHFACHGEFDEASPLNSWLEIGEDERLTAAEVLRDWQLQAELVTLSACRSGVNHHLRGDEPMGLMRAFLAAGARAVLVSQWPVEDLPTFLLMRHFYQRLQENETFDPAAALQAAQVWLRHLTGAEAQTALTGLAAEGVPTQATDFEVDYAPEATPFAHPRYWAAFILVGV